MKEKNTTVRLAKRPVGLPEEDTWSISEEDIGTPGDGQVLVRVDYISLDPAMRGWLNDARSYIEPVGIGDVMRAGAVGQVLQSGASEFTVGDYVTGGLGVQTHAIIDAKELDKVDPNIAPLPRFLGVLGMPGMTAYFGLLDVGALKDGETVVVSGAAGAVGSVVGQIAKLKGCTVIGIAGGAEKCKLVVDDYGFDACIDYKNENVRDALKQHVPQGIDVYFDNVGGDILDAVLTRLARGARIVICGAISQYNNTTPIKGPSNYLSLLVSRARMEGFVVFDYRKRYMEAARDMAGWMAEEKLIAREDIRENIRDFPRILQMLFKGENIGKLILKP